MTGPFRRSNEGRQVERATPAAAPSAADAVARAFERIAADGATAIWIDLVDQLEAERSAAGIDARVAAGEHLPLAGLTVAVKNNIDVAGLRTTAGCPSFGRVAERHAPAVQRLVDAGAVVVGATNLDQFATGLVGTRSPYGICPNAHWDGLISGGSSSGSAVAVARGLVDIGVGTDTAGSGRVPAAANGIVGWKPTKSWVSTDGVVPACASLDCVSFFGRDAEVLTTVRHVVAGDVTRGGAGPHDRAVGVRLGVPDPAELSFDGDERWGEACVAAIGSVAASEHTVPVPVRVDRLLDTGRLLYEGAFVRERFDAVGEFIERHRDDVDPVVYSIIHAAGSLRREDLDHDRGVITERARELGGLWDETDAVVLPTVPRVPRVDEVRAEPIAVNSMLGTYTNFVNLLGLCAVTVPVGTSPSGPPPSVSLVAPAGRDDLLLALARDLAERALVDAG